MSSEAFAPSSSSSQPRREEEEEEEENNQPTVKDFMANDELMENLKALNEETKSDDDEEEEAGTSGPPKVLPILTPSWRNLRKRVEVSGKPTWIWFMNFKLPCLSIGGEPRLPIEVIVYHIQQKQEVPEDINAMLDRVLRSKNIFTRMATARQIRMFNEMSEVCRMLNLSSIMLINRSDIERLMGELRVESRPTKCETDEPWNDDDRVLIVHLNFIDYCDDWLENDDDLMEDEEDAGTQGYWYKNRPNMRSIVCRTCSCKFTPADFILHHHFPVKNTGIIHVGLNSAKWPQFIVIHKDHRTEENVEAWENYVYKGTRGVTKRALDEADPQKELFKSDVSMEVEVEVEDVEMDEENGDAVKKPTPTLAVNLCNFDPDIDGPEPKKKLTIADYMGPSGSDGKFLVQPRNEFEKNLLDVLNKLDPTTLEYLFEKPVEEFEMYMKDLRYAERQRILEKKFEALHKHPDALKFVSSHFNPTEGEFVGMHTLNKASKAVKMEIQEITAKFAKVDRNGDFYAMLKAEQEIYKEASDEAICVLSNKVYVPPPPPPPVAMKPEMTSQQMNIVAIAQQILASGKLPQIMAQMQQMQGMPGVPPLNRLFPSTAMTPMTSTPQLPMTPHPLISPALSLPLTPQIPMPIKMKGTPSISISPSPILPIGAIPQFSIAQQVEIMKQQLAMKPSFYPMLPMPQKLPMPVDQLLAQLKTPQVKN